MKSYLIKGIPFECDDSKVYLDFFISEGKPTLVEIQWDIILESIQKGETEPESSVMVLWDRWIRDVPRKRFYRKMVMDGACVLSGEYWFENLPDAEAEDIFVKLENTGRLARKFLETFYPEIAEQCIIERWHPAAEHYQRKK